MTCDGWLLGGVERRGPVRGGQLRSGRVHEDVGALDFRGDG